MMQTVGKVKRAVLGLCGALVVCAALRANDLVITEVMAINNRTLVDERGATPDWIEIYNAGSTVVDLDGWHLTDDPDELAMWTFPPRELAPGEFLIVFASGDDLRDPAGELHTNFELDGEGEFLGLAAPDRTLISYFVPSYPVQVADASYGRAMQTVSTVVLAEGAAARYLVPADNTLDDVWFATDFDDAAWATGPTAIGFDDNEVPAFAGLIQTNVSAAMTDINSSLYVRIPFTVPSVDPSVHFRLRVKYDDGLIAWVNGAEVARLNSRSTAPRYNWRAAGDRGTFDLGTFEDIFLPAGAVVAGANVLALQVMNRADTDPDLLIVAVIEAISITGIDVQKYEFFEFSSPRFPNLGGLPEAAPQPEFSKSSGAYAPGNTLTLTAPGGAEIRYTLDGTEPERDSTAYTGPLPIDGTILVKARTYKAGAIPGRVRTESYILIDQGLTEFTSHLPIVVCTTFGRALGGSCDGLYTDGHVMIFEPGEDGLARLTSPALVAESAGFRRRGSSTCGRPKFSFNVEVRDQQGEDKDIQVFDFAQDSDYVMYGAYNFDRVHMRNPIAYWMSREVGRWAARTRFVECFFHQSAGPIPNNLRTGSYMGLYSFMEKNKRHPEKVDVEQLGRSDIAPPAVEGGYIMKRDRVGSGEISTTAGGYSSLVFVYPKQPEAQQRTWMTTYVNRAIASLSPQIGSQADSDLIDVMQFIDHHILCWYPKNVDAFRLSGYFHKRRDGLLAMGPVWDYDRTMGCADDARADSPEGWDNNLSSGDGGTRYFQSGGLGSWYSLLFNNVPPTGNDPWATAYRARWRELRAGPLATANILDQIDAWAVEIADAFERNRVRWPEVGPRFGGFQGEVDHLKNWLARRADWIDSQFIEPPSFSHPGGLVEPGLQVSITAPEGTVYFTLNGPDPAGANRQPVPEAQVYSAPLTINTNTRLRARSLVGAGVWSELIEATYVTDPPDLVVTEVMFDPPEFPGDAFSPSQYEFLEVQNVGATSIALAGFTLIRSETSSLFDFNDSLVTIVEPGAFVVIPKNPAALVERYGEGLSIAGVLSGTLSNRSQRIALLGPLGEAAVDFEYDAAWYPETNGTGASLVIADAGAPRAMWNEAAGWRASAEPGGSPGRADGPVAGGSQLPGDASQDGALNLLDGLVFLNQLLGLTDQALPCGDGSFTDPANRALLDANADRNVDITDAVYVLNYLFLEGPAHALGATCRPLAGCPEICP